MLPGPDDSELETKSSINWEDLLYKFRFQIIIALTGAILIGFGLLVFKNAADVDKSGVEVLETSTGAQDESLEVVVEIAGAVERPGVYKLSNDSRIEDVLIKAGGINADADRNWMERSLNRAAKIVDGQKIYIPRYDEQSTVLSANNSGGYQTGSSNFSGQNSGLINVNTASQKELESLWGIGPVYAQNIIEHRPYSSVEELLEKGIIKTNVYERNKDLLTVY
jgi:competence protein ComEA